MTPVHFVHAIEGLLAAGALIWFFCGPWQTLCTAVSRQRQFELRNRLFDLAADGKIEFSHPAYQSLRNFLNANIRFSHAMTFGGLLITVAVADTRAYSREPLPDVVERVNEPEVRVALREIMQQSVLAASTHMFVRSPLLWLFLPLVILLIAIFTTSIVFTSRLAEWLISSLELRNYSEAHAV